MTQPWTDLIIREQLHSQMGALGTHAGRGILVDLGAVRCPEVMTENVCGAGGDLSRCPVHGGGLYLCKSEQYFRLLTVQLETIDITLLYNQA